MAGRAIAAVLAVALAAAQGLQMEPQDHDAAAVHLDGRSGFLATAGAGPGGQWDSASVSFWVRPERKARDSHLETCAVSQGSWEGRFKVALLPDWRLRWTVRTKARGGRVADCDSAAALTAGRWHHVAATYDAKLGPALFLDGRSADAQCSRRVSGALAPSRAPLTVGRCYADKDTADWFRGSVAALQLWDHALTTLEVRDAMAAPAAAAQFPLVGSVPATLEASARGVSLVPMDSADWAMAAALARSLDDAGWAAADRRLRRLFEDREELQGVRGDLEEMYERAEVLGDLVSRSFPRRPQEGATVIIAVVVPATSRGTSGRVEDQPLYNGLLTSLFLTAEEGFEYVLYVAFNEDDPLYSSPDALPAMFDAANRSCGPAKVGFRPVPVPARLTPSIALSALFNVPALAAAAEGADYIYVVNDDLRLVSPRWTSRFVDALAANGNVGVAGAVDVSDTATPQIEFPFVHRTHADIFGWCGVQPWVFRNWWEDNWLTDVYLPFGAVFYLRDVAVANYAGLGRSGDDGATDPRYEVRGGRRVPEYYVAEVEAGRRRVAAHLSAPSADYCSAPGTLADMPHGPHELPISPCAADFYVPPNAVEHEPYAPLPPAAPAPSHHVDAPRHPSTGATVIPGEFCRPGHPQHSAPACAGPRRTVAVLHMHVPLFDRYGCDKRLLHVVESLVGLGHRVALFGKDVTDFERREHRVRLTAMGVDVFDPLARGDRAVPGNVARAVDAVRPDVVLSVLWFWASKPVTEVFPRSLLAPDARHVVLSDDVHFARARALGGGEDDEDLFEREAAAYAAADHVLFITEEDAERAHAAFDLPAASVLPIVAADAWRAAEAPLAGRAGLLLVGNGANPTNQRSLEWFVADVLPLLPAHVALTVVGAEWPRQLAGPRVALHGFADDLEPLLAAARVFVSPIVASTGINTKNVLALEAGLPLVTTTLGSDGLGGPAGPLLVEDSAEGFAAAVERLLVDDDLWGEMAEGGQAHVRRLLGRRRQLESLGGLLGS